MFSNIETQTQREAYAAMLFKMCTCTKENKERTVKYCVNQLQIDQEQQDKNTRKYLAYTPDCTTLTHTQKFKKSIKLLQGF